MPTKPPRVCGCGHRVPSTTRCPCQVKADHARKARHDEKRPSANARGYGSKWQAARVEYLRANPRYARCGAPATVVHHVTPHRGDQKLFWRRSNWQPACKPCHDGPLQAVEKKPTA
ncbi:HNH endonuclease [Aureimonas leprariae]|uniref:HNH endonuclease n=1 Tax=Plantimonas leprariae TaxID=2615207 RepID=A0A7V7PNT6_9HYPH|nr:HNH endonuclease [Aureimonas leprariae]KAB0679520.1 HNH endonuclease [Aureimonas leprariae]